MVNRDLIEQASDLEDELNQQGSIRYIWVPRSKNEKADAAVNEALDELDEPDDRFWGGPSRA